MVNKVYINEETAITWLNTGGTYALDLGTTGGDAGAVRVGARGDLGAAPRSEWYAWRMHIDGFDTAPVVGEEIDVYLALSDGTNEDGDVGTADANGATTDLPNLKYLTTLTVQTTTAGNDLNRGGVVRITERYVSPVVHNNTADKLLSTADAHKFSLTPIPPEIQD
jgi:hypothetical protein